MILTEMEDKGEEPYLVGRYYRNVIRVKGCDVFYIEKAKHGSLVYAKEKWMYPPFQQGIPSRERLDSLKDRLMRFGFACPHNSYLVNLEYVERVNKGKELILSNGVILPISRSKVQGFLQKYMEYLEG